MKHNKSNPTARPLNYLPILYFLAIFSHEFIVQAMQIRPPLCWCQQFQGLIRLLGRFRKVLP